ncbi:3ccdd7e9-afad-43f0-b567-785093e95e4f-CDS [Sclerotinia trifoliorum]|uniref:3ccdd7e9-afad-43f0-b567-785093e95e4f-CDS n=1 Tax=Sclerotinia trifoliorum TaxID=28548 RepID=A0A8H2W0W9_9HELO|nr:3ccdd7e9-afad-43f0-b567-785093e95e4f-CDS [Sclerotinia trifoliorum]
MLNFELKEVQWDERLGFGIEFEFALATLPLGTEDPEPEDGRGIYSIDAPLDYPETVTSTLSDIDRELNVQLHIVNTLKTNGFSAASQIQLERYRKAWKNGNLDKEPDPSDILWIVKRDDTIQFPTAQVKTYKWYKVEICTPGLMFSPWNVRHIWDVLGVLRSRYRLSCNQSCGLHIHVGLGKKEFSLDVLKNLMAIIFTFERQLEQCHPSHRMKNKYSYPLRDHANINENYEPGKNFSCSDKNWKYNRCLERRRRKLPTIPAPGRSARDSLAAIFNAKSRAEIVKMFKSDEDIRLGYNIQFLDEPYPDPFKQTIEFRQHEATTVPKRIERWLNICCRLVDVARQTASASDEEKAIFHDFLQEHIGEDVEEFGLVILLVNLGLMQEAEFYSYEMANNPELRPQRKSMYDSSSIPSNPSNSSHR